MWLIILRATATPGVELIVPMGSGGAGIVGVRKASKPVKGEASRLAVARVGSGGGADHHSGERATQTANGILTKS
jgi:hypothetical protein